MFLAPPRTDASDLPEHQQLCHYLEPLVSPSPPRRERITHDVHRDPHIGASKLLQHASGFHPQALQPRLPLGQHSHLVPAQMARRSHFALLRASSGRLRGTLAKVEFFARLVRCCARSPRTHLTFRHSQNPTPELRDTSTPRTFIELLPPALCRFRVRTKYLRVMQADGDPRNVATAARRTFAAAAARTSDMGVPPRMPERQRLPGCHQDTSSPMLRAHSLRAAVRSLSTRAPAGRLFFERWPALRQAALRYESWAAGGTQRLLQ